MGELFWNKVFGAVLATALVVFGIKELGHALIHPHEPAEPGYKIAVAEEGGAKEKAKEAAPVKSLAEMLSEASASSGERVAKKCAACHDFTKGGPNKTGPNLWNVLGRTAGTHEGFNYSDAMKAFGKVWDYETLDAFVSSPKTEVPGTAMGFAGLKKPKDAANLLAYLRTLSDAPMPLPALPASTADAAATVTEAADAATTETAHE
ncbi:MAG: cytochrome c family protein [Robiginitomaculum sp.]|nr:cytochrome c family protein [Robiginitomaculum sp.]